MIRFLKHSEIDKDRWNKAVSEAPNATIFVDFDFLCIGNPNWCALVEDDYQCVMPLPVKSKLSIHYIFTPFFYHRLGIFSKEPISAEKVKAFIDAIPRKYRQIDLALNEYNPATLVERKAINMIYHEVNLSPSYEEIYQQYSKNNTKNIKVARKKNLQYIEDISFKEIIKLFRLNRGKDRSVKFKKRDYYNLMRMAHVARTRRQVDAVGVVFDQKLIAGALFLKDKKRTWFWFSGRDNTHTDKKTMYFLIDEYIQRHANQPRILEFSGSLNQNIAMFYKGFGGVPHNYTMLHFTRDFYLGGLIKLYKAIKS